jgi:hypothetical protein
MIINLKRASQKDLIQDNLPFRFCIQFESKPSSLSKTQNRLQFCHFCDTFLIIFIKFIIIQLLQKIEEY